MHESINAWMNEIMNVWNHGWMNGINEMNREWNTDWINEIM